MEANITFILVVPLLILYVFVFINTIEQRLKTEKTSYKFWDTLPIRDVFFATLILDCIAVVQVIGGRD